MRTRGALALLAAVTTAVSLALGAAPAQAVATTDDELVVRDWYGLVLHRAADLDPSASYWSNRLAAGAKPGDVAWDLFHTPEHAGDQVAGEFQDRLNRDPRAEEAYWAEGIAAKRFPAEWMKQNVTASPEFTRLSRPEQVILDWYDVVLGRGELFNPRAPSADATYQWEIDYWSARRAQVGDLSALREIWYSPEAVARRLQTNFQYYLKRAPTAGEVAWWTPKEVESDDNVAVLLLATPEFRAKVLATYRD